MTASVDGTHHQAAAAKLWGLNRGWTFTCAVDKQGLKLLARESSPTAINTRKGKVARRARASSRKDLGSSDGMYAESLRETASILTGEMTGIPRPSDRWRRLMHI